MIRKNFTLLELLLVISIIIMLAGMLLPALSKARERVKGIQCMNNQRQCGLALFQYGEDNNGVIMLNYGISTITWAALLNYKTMKEYFYNPPYFQSLGGDYLKARDVMVCPSMIPNTWEALNFTYGVPYSYNDHPGSRYDEATRPTSYSAFGGTEVIPSRLKAPSQFFMVGDTWRSDTAKQCYFVNLLNTDKPYRLHLRHSNQANILWADGHAGGTSITEIRTIMPRTVNHGSVFSVWKTIILL